MERAERESYIVCPERNSPDAFRHFFERDYPRFEDAANTSWRLRLGQSLSGFYRLLLR